MRRRRRWNKDHSCFKGLNLWCIRWIQEQSGSIFQPQRLRLGQCAKMWPTVFSDMCKGWTMTTTDKKWILPQVFSFHPEQRPEQVLYTACRHFYIQYLLITQTTYEIWQAIVCKMRYLQHVNPLIFHIMSTIWPAPQFKKCCASKMLPAGLPVWGCNRKQFALTPLMM